MLMADAAQCSAQAQLNMLLLYTVVCLDSRKQWIILDYLWEIIAVGFSLCGESRW